MVRTAFSRGCERCRAKHIGCDQTIPDCANCTAHGLSCPGYRDQGGFLFKDESAKVIKNGDQRHSRRTTTAVKTESTTTSCTGILLGSASRSLSSLQVHLLHKSSTGFSRNLQYDYLCFVLETHVMFNRHANRTPTHSKTLISLVRNANSSSLLYPVISQVGEQLLLLHRGIRNNSPQHLQTRIDASEAMRVALCNPVQRSKNETLFALILLDFGECIEDARSLAFSAAGHHFAALAIISERGPASFEDAESQVLLDAVRYSVIKKALLGREDHIDLNVLINAKNSKSKIGSTELDSTVLRVLNLRRQVSALRCSKQQCHGQMVHGLDSVCQMLDTELRGLVDTIPAVWAATSQPYPDLQLTRQHRVNPESHLSRETKVIRNQWRCIRLLLLGIWQSLLPHKTPIEVGQDNSDAQTTIKEQAQTLCNAILSSVTSLFIESLEDGKVAAAGKSTDESRSRNANGEKEKETQVSHTIVDRFGNWNLFELLRLLLSILADVDYGISVDPAFIVTAKEILAHLWV